MPRDDMETASNREAEGGLTPTATQAQRPFGPSGNVNGLQITAPLLEGEIVPEEQAHTDAEWLSFVKAAKSSSDQYMGPIRTSWSNNYRAYRNQHHEKSTFNSERWRGRSKLHRPKTHSAVHKGDATAASALFTSSDIIEVEPTNPLNPQDQATAEILKEIINLRLGPKSGKAGVPWFKTIIGAHNDCQMTALCCLKVYWDYKALARQGEPITDEAGMQIVNPDTGEPAVRNKILRDRPMIRLFPMELVIRDPAASWLDQAQESSFLGLMHPMRVGDAEALMKANQKSAVPWRKIDRSDLVRAGAGNPIEAQGVTNAREGTTAERQTRNKVSTPARDYDMTYLVEWFVRRDDQEWHFWTAYTDKLLSDPVPVEEVYPHLQGERPVVIGTGKIEPHKIDPISKVAAALPLQQEINELVNTRLEAVKQNAFPLTILKRGAQLDVKQIQYRGPDSAIFANNVEEDLKFDRPPDVGSEAYLEMSNLNADYDELVGTFNASTVQNSRQMNETVGGMNLMSGAANVTADFDLTVFVKTTCDPALNQIAKLEQYYEDDATILSIAGEKAQLFEKFGIDEITDELLSRDVTVSVAAGIGNADPMVKQQKLITSLMALGQMMGPQLASRAKQDEIIDEVMGTAGFSNASERFFNPMEDEDPRLQQAMQALQMMQAQVEDKQADRDNKIEVSRISSATTLINTILGAQAKMVQADQAHQQQIESGVVDHGMQMEAGAVEHQRGMEGKAHDHVHDLHKTQVTGEQKSQQIQQGAQAQVASQIDPNLVMQLLMSALPTIMPNTPIPDLSGQGGQGMGQGGGMPGQGMMMPQGGMGSGGASQPQQDPMAEMMQMMMQQQQQTQQTMMALAQTMSQVGQGLQSLAQATSSPKVIIRDPMTGQPIGTKPLLPSLGVQP